MMGMSGFFGGFHMVFGLLYIALVVYFFYLLHSMNKSLKLIASKVDTLDQIVSKPNMEKQ